MASVRIEDEARTDPRFSLLGERIQTNRFDALGRMIEVWAYCTDRQTYHIRTDMLDAMVGIKNFGAHLIACDLAKPIEEGSAESQAGFYIKGTRGRIEWLKKLRNNGKKGGRPKKTKTKPEANQNRTASEPPPNPLITVPAPVISLSPVSKNKELKAVANAPAQLPAKRGHSLETKQAAGKFCGAYVKAYQSRFPNQRPFDLYDKVTQGQILNLIAGGFPIEKLCELVQAYFQIEDKWFGQRGYSFATFKANLNKIGQALEGGADPSAVDWGKVFAGAGAV